MNDQEMKKLDGAIFDIFLQPLPPGRIHTDVSIAEKLKKTNYPFPANCVVLAEVVLSLDRLKLHRGVEQRKCADKGYWLPHDVLMKYLQISSK